MCSADGCASIPGYLYRAGCSFARALLLPKLFPRTLTTLVLLRLNRVACVSRCTKTGYAVPHPQTRVELVSPYVSSYWDIIVYNRKWAQPLRLALNCLGMELAIVRAVRGGQFIQIRNAERPCLSLSRSKGRVRHFCAPRANA